VWFLRFFLSSKRAVEDNALGGHGCWPSVGYSGGESLKLPLIPQVKDQSCPSQSNKQGYDLAGVDVAAVQE